MSMFRDQYGPRTWVAAAIGAVLFVVVMTGALAASHYECETVVAGEAQVETSWRIIGGCFVEVEDGTFVPLDTWRSIRAEIGTALVCELVDDEIDCRELP